jgi:hypothetical protein
VVRRFIGSNQSLPPIFLQKLGFTNVKTGNPSGWRHLPVAGYRLLNRIGFCKPWVDEYALTLRAAMTYIALASFTHTRTPALAQTRPTLKVAATWPATCFFDVTLYFPKE